MLGAGFGEGYGHGLADASCSSCDYCRLTLEGEELWNGIIHCESIDAECVYLFGRRCRLVMVVLGDGGPLV